MEFRHGDAVAPLEIVGPGNGRRGTEVTFLPSTDTFTMIEFDYGTLEKRLRELAFLNSGVRIVLTDARHAEHKREELYYEGGIEAFVRYLDRSRKPIDGITKPGGGPLRARRHPRRGRVLVERLVQRDGAAVHQQHPAARRRHPHGGLPRRADPPDHRLCRIRRASPSARRSRSPARIAARASPRSSRCRCPIRNSRRRPRTSSVSSEVRPAVENVLNEGLSTWLEENPPAGPLGDGQGRAGGLRPRGRPQGARDRDPQGRARHRLAARQARRLPGARSDASARSCWSRATRPAARPSRAATGRSRRCCRCAARS